MRRLFVPICFGLLIALGVPSVQAGNQEEANRIAQRLTQQYPQYNIEVAYQEGKVRLRGEVASEADRDAIANFVRRIPKVRTVSETMTISPNAATFAPAQAAPQYGEPFGERIRAIRPVQALSPAPVAEAPVVAAEAAAPVADAAPVVYGAAPVANEVGQTITTYPGAPLGVPADGYAAPATRSPSDFFAPQGAYTPATQNGQPNLPNYAWPSYADYPNYSQVTYPKNYAADAFPYVGPFYPYPEVPLGWRKVTMQWHDGYWWVDFNDGSKNGPFSPLFRQQSQYR
ncbi:MAG: BON domain-containing protein [Planctomycetia bacterium]|nr:BON domain-containing protein [Planctomycetia bacterium]